MGMGMYSAFMNGTLNDKCNTTSVAPAQKQQHRQSKRNAPKWPGNDDLRDESSLRRFLKRREEKKQCLVQ